MARGDQIYVMREFMGLPGLYEHHGIDCGDGTVIHYQKTEVARISRTSMAEFAKGQPVYVKRYSTSYLPDVVIQRAESRIGEQAYNLTTNNCEHFATWCKTGLSESAQLHNFGLDVGRISLPGTDKLIHEAIDNSSPTKSMELYRQALSNIATAESTLRPQYQHAQKEENTWHRVALLALHQGREELARAALYRKVSWKKTAADFKSQIDYLETLKAQLQRDSLPLRQTISTNS
jgi:hypothetical protein